MLKFKAIELSDREIIESYTLSCGMCNCDITFANIYCWQPIFHSAWCVVEGWLLIRFMISGGTELGYMQPLSRSGEEDFSHLIPLLAQDAHSNGDRLRIIGLTEAGCRALDRVHEGRFAFHSDRNFEEYIYSREDLETLRGKRYQPKRNHINQFESRYNYRYEKLNSEHFSACLELDSIWRGEGNNKSPERIALERGLANYEALRLEGGALFVEDALVGFCYGSANNETTFCINIEKCDTNYVGSYAMLNKLFATSLAPQFTEINREEDMGIEGLRRAKLSYHPTRLNTKYTAIYLHHAEAECKRLWQEVFGDEDSFIDEFIIYHYSRSGHYSVVDPLNRHLAMVHIVPFESELGRVAYIYGVATHPDHRGHGYAAKLLKEALHRIKEEGYALAALIPSEEWLHAYYAQFGFTLGAQLLFKLDSGFDFGTGDMAKDMSMVLNINNLEIPKVLTLKR